MVRRQAEVARIDAELAGDDSVKAVDGVPLAVMLEAQAQMQANRSAVIAAESEERARLAGAGQERAAALQQRTRLLAVLPIYRQQEGAFDRLVADGFAGELMAGDKRRERIEREQELATQEHVIASAEASIKQSQEKLARIRADYHRGLHSERQVSQTEIERLEKEVTKHLHRQRLAELRAPHDGVIKELATSTLGTVVQPGTVLATLVPSDEHLKAEVWLSNQDVGFVYPGQSAKLKFTAFRFQKYGMAEGSVEHIGADAQSDDEGRDRGSANHAQAMRYKTLVSLDKPYLEQDGKVFSLAPGMQVSAEIMLGQRTVMEYLLSPIQKAWHEAARER